MTCSESVLRDKNSWKESSENLSQKEVSLQACATFLTNPHLTNFAKGTIYTGPAKSVCVPGLNCYSCPAATGACPIGAFQAVVGSSKFSYSYYITGILILIGTLLGRFVCGFPCPFGWVQDLLHKIPFPKKFSTKKAQSLALLEVRHINCACLGSTSFDSKCRRNGRAFFLQVCLSTGNS